MKRVNRCHCDEEPAQVERKSGTDFGLTYMAWGIREDTSALLYFAQNSRKESLEIRLDFGL